MNDFSWDDADLGDLEDETRQQRADQRLDAIRDAEPWRGPLRPRERGVPLPLQATDFAPSSPDFESSPTCSEPLPGSE